MTMRRMLILVVAIAMASCAALHKSNSANETPTELNSPVPGTVIVTGTVTNTGVECPAVLGDDGKTYTIATTTPMVPRSGTHVRIVGSFAQASTCQQGTTIRATSIDNISATVVDPTANSAPTRPR